MGAPGQECRQFGLAQRVRPQRDEPASRSPVEKEKRVRSRDSYGEGGGFPLRRLPRAHYATSSFFQKRLPALSGTEEGKARASCTTVRLPGADDHPLWQTSTFSLPAASVAPQIAADLSARSRSSQTGIGGGAAVPGDLFARVPEISALEAPRTCSGVTSRPRR